VSFQRSSVNHKERCILAIFSKSRKNLFKDSHFAPSDKPVIKSLRACLETSAFIVTRMYVDKKNCARQQKLAKTVKRYPSALTDKEWALVPPLLPPASREGRRRKTDLREIINALRYLIRSGWLWRMLPQEFGPWQTVYWWFRRLMRRFLFATILDSCAMLDRHRQKKALAPSLAILDSQSVKAPHASDRGIDAHKKVVGRKRHVAMDSDGRLLLVNMTPANVADSTGAQMILDAISQVVISKTFFCRRGL